MFPSVWRWFHCRTLVACAKLYIMNMLREPSALSEMLARERVKAWPSRGLGRQRRFLPNVAERRRTLPSAVGRSRMPWRGRHQREDRLLTIRRYTFQRHAYSRGRSPPWPVFIYFCRPMFCPILIQTVDNG